MPCTLQQNSAKPTHRQRTFNENSCGSNIFAIIWKTFLRRTCTLFASYSYRSIILVHKILISLGNILFSILSMDLTVFFLPPSNSYVHIYIYSENEHSSLKNYPHQNYTIMSTNESIYEKFKQSSNLFCIAMCTFSFTCRLNSSEMLMYNIDGDFHQSFCCRFNYVLN